MSGRPDPAAGPLRDGPGLLLRSGAWAAASALATAVLLGASGAQALASGRLLALAALSAAIAWIDARTRRIPNRLTAPTGAGMAASLAAAGEWPALGAAALGAAALGALYLAIALIGTMGLGDVKLAALVGAALLPECGWPALVGSCAAAYALACPHALAKLVRRPGGRGGELPFGPYLVAGAWLAAAPTLMITVFNFPL